MVFNIDVAWSTGNHLGGLENSWKLGKPSTEFLGFYYHHEFY